MVVEAYPEASSYAPTGLAAKRPDLTCTDALGPALDQAFGTDLLRIPIAGMPKFPDDAKVDEQLDREIHAAPAPPDRDPVTQEVR